MKQRTGAKESRGYRVDRLISQQRRFLWLAAITFTIGAAIFWGLLALEAFSIIISEATTWVLWWCQVISIVLSAWAAVGAVIVHYAATDEPSYDLRRMGRILKG